MQYDALYRVSQFNTDTFTMKSVVYRTYSIIYIPCYLTITDFKHKIKY